MTVEQFYVEIGGNCKDVLSRLGKMERIAKYLNKFSETDEASNFENLLSQKNYEEAFRCVHSIKGMCLNLGLVGLLDVAAPLCEELRDGEPKNDITQMCIKLKDEYKKTIDAIAKIDPGE